MEIQVMVKSVYGENKVYPVCDTAKKFCELTGRKTLTRRDLQVIASLGYAVEQTLGELVAY